jgi:hypothetical protein
MDWSKWFWVAGPAVAIIGWFGATFVRSWLEGTPLNGLRRAVGMAPAQSKKVSLSVIVLTAPEPKWHIGAMGKTPMLNLTIHASLAHKSEESVKIVQGYGHKGNDSNDVSSTLSALRDKLMAKAVKCKAARKY